MGQLEQARSQIRAVLLQFLTTAVTRTPITKTTSNVNGDETLTAGTPATINVYIARKNRPWFLDKAGLVEGGDAIMLVAYSQTIAKDDKITWNGNDYRVQTVLDRDMLGGGIAYRTCNLFLI
jgi:hypothetical protein